MNIYQPKLSVNAKLVAGAVIDKASHPLTLEIDVDSHLLITVVVIVVIVP